MLLVAGAVGVVALEMIPDVLPQNAVSIAGDGSTHSFTLLKDTQYGFYSEDPDLRCEVTDPSGSPLTLSSTLAQSASSPPQVLGFSSTQAGPYSVSCSGASAITCNVARVSPDTDRLQTVVLCATITGVIMGLLILTDLIWLLVLRLRRPRPAPSAPVSDPAPGAPQPLDAPGPTGAAPSAEPGAAPVAPPTPGAYGLAPQQVVYRPMPPPRGPDGS
ncbi:MAG: hypothetical protein DI576_13800 [Actinomyces sp.]|nr:MAG: hypothetical protein DI576_13800 [Actinomyces sp.]